MEKWLLKEARHRLFIDVFDPLGSGREAEPLEVALSLGALGSTATRMRVYDEDGAVVSSQVTGLAPGADGGLAFANLCFIIDMAAGATSRRYHVYLHDGAVGDGEPLDGMRQLKPELSDGVRRLDTGAYVLELCRGTAAGHGGSKWGIRHFESKQQGVNLIKDHNNALGGVYGPFFTIENGLINPPAHMVIDVQPLTEGPVLCRYRMRGVVPDGLRPELKGKRLDMVWSFYHRSHWFVRQYVIDDYETTIDGRPCRNRMTVGDEIESGEGNLLLSTYKHYEGTRYRSGDLYHKLLLDHIADLRGREPELVGRAMKQLGIDPQSDTSAWHWDNYWRLFCVIEKALPNDVLIEEAESIRRAANRVVWSDPGHTKLHFTNDHIDVSEKPQQSIFPLNARKTCEFSPETGFSFVRYVNRVVPRMNIIQRRSSGWVNWGTNGENEYPELSSGSTIWSAYGRFDDWELEADRMQTPVAISIGPVMQRDP